MNLIDDIFRFLSNNVLFYDYIPKKETAVVFNNIYYIFMS